MRQHLPSSHPLRQYHSSYNLSTDTSSVEFIIFSWPDFMHWDANYSSVILPDVTVFLLSFISSTVYKKKNQALVVFHCFFSPLVFLSFSLYAAARQCLALGYLSQWQWRRTIVAAAMSLPYAGTSLTGISSRFTLSTHPATTLWVIQQPANKLAEVFGLDFLI